VGITLLIRISNFSFYIHLRFYTFILLAPIASFISTENVLRKEVRTAFEPNGSFNRMIHNLEEKGKFSPILLIYCTCVVCSVVFQELHLIVYSNNLFYSIHYGGKNYLFDVYNINYIPFHLTSNRS
jgi:hypothetical protein